jgi:hypothetical protein
VPDVPEVPDVPDAPLEAPLEVIPLPGGATPDEQASKKRRETVAPTVAYLTARMIGSVT